MKRKFAIGFATVLLATTMLGACGSADPTTVEYNGVTYADLKEQNFAYLQEFADTYNYAEENGIAIEDLVKQVSANGYAAEAAGLDSWATAVEECGSYVGYDESTFTTTKSGKTVTSDVTVQFTDRTATFEVVYTYYNMEISGYSVTTDYTLGEKMTKAGLNTLISMAIVFMVLILIAVIIYAFNIFPYIEKKKKEKAAAARAAAPQPAPAAEPAAPVVEEELMDDTELIAVIAAAIAASEGTSTDGFVVRSINRR